MCGIKQPFPKRVHVIGVDDLEEHCNNMRQVSHDCIMGLPWQGCTLHLLWRWGVNKKKSRPTVLPDTPPIKKVVNGQRIFVGMADIKANRRRPPDGAISGWPKANKRSIPRPDLRVEPNGGVTIFGRGNNGEYLESDVPDDNRRNASVSSFRDVVYCEPQIREPIGDRLGRRGVQAKS